MKPYRYFVLILISFFYQQFCFSQTSMKAKNLLDEVSEKMNSYDNFKFQFKYILENSKEDIRQETEGEITVSGEKYKLNFDDAIQLFDGKNLYTIIPENEEIMISKPEEDNDIIINPTDLIKFYNTGYDFHWDIIQYVNKVPIQYVKLIPADENPDITYLLLGINMKTKNIYRLIEIGQQNTTTTLTLTSIITNQVISDDFFKFHEKNYPSFYIN
ncbi:MAG: hypothetical protein CMC79_05485 [Flavobacteriaceae bacterium]|nr:hypothetical protein [Flavobacteriaceae bacterium]|tara:strand:- start:3476 stop:4120 length:645 start_codon:yes stop_codon:yes gene_type:complete